MALCAKIAKEKAEQVRRKLAAKGLIDNGYFPARDKEFVYFALVPAAKKTDVKRLGAKAAQKELAMRGAPPKSLQDALSGKLPAGALEKVVRAFDIIGDIAVLEIPPSIGKYENEIAAAVLAVHHNVKVVAKKLSGMQGTFRVRELQVIGGESRTEATYRESGALFRLDIGKVYFSPRLGTERLRIAKLVRKKERILVLFAGVGPFPIIISKRHPDAEIVAIELNPDAVSYMKENIALNKCENITPVLGDVREIVPARYVGWADRVLMPLPRDAEKFLDVALAGAKKGAAIHLYTFAKQAGPYEKAEERIAEECKKAGRKCRITARRVVRPFAPHVVQAVVDFRAL